MQESAYVGKKEKESEEGESVVFPRGAAVECWAVAGSSGSCEEPGEKRRQRRLLDTPQVPGTLRRWEHLNIPHVPQFSPQLLRRLALVLRKEDESTD